MPTEYSAALPPDPSAEAASGASRTVTARVAGSLVIAWILVVTGALGLLAAAALILDEIELLADPQATLACSLNALVDCSASLNSAQGAILGVPNALLGVAFWPAVGVVGVALLDGARFTRWFWLVFNGGLAAALGLVVWFVAQSVFVIGVLCPWCMLTWAVTIPAFVAVTLHNVGTGTIPAPAWLSRSARQRWILPVTLLGYAIVAVVAWFGLDLFARLIA